MPSQAERLEKYMLSVVSDTLDETATAFYEEVVEATPVQSGRLRQGWKMKRGEVNKAVPKLRPGKYRKPHTPRLAKATPDGNNSIYVSNGVPYILESNFGDADNPPKNFIQAALAKALNK